MPIIRPILNVSSLSAKRGAKSSRFLRDRHVIGGFIPQGINADRPDAFAELWAAFTQGTRQIQ